MTNPTSGADASDAGGWFPQIYAAEALTFDILLKTSAGATVASYLSVVSLGANTGTLTRDFTTSRFSARGAGGITYIEAGDPVGDDVGGKLTLGGWLGTQADEIDINAALVNVLGRLKEGGYKLPGVVRSENQTFSGAAFFVIPLTNDPTGVRAFEVDVIDLASSSTATQNWTVTMSFDGGATYAAANYNSTDETNYAGTAGGSSASGAVAALMVAGACGVANLPALIRMTVVTPNSGSNFTIVQGYGLAQNFTGAQMMNFTFNIAGPASAGRCTHLKITSTAGNLSGLFRVMPQRGLGEV